MITINQLIKKLEKIRDENHKAMYVVIDRDTFSDEYNMSNLGEVEVDRINWDKTGDHTYENADGSKSTRKVCILKGYT